jgi:3,4-dihydroxy 2-butanone 4-phosphate synthase/GTP cyclohydrolase II
VTSQPSDPSAATVSVADAAGTLGRGEPVLVVDGLGPDTIGMLILSAQHADAAGLHRLTRRAGGESYLALTAERCDQLGLDRVTAAKDDLVHPPATVPISAVDGVTHGMGVAERARTIAVAIDPALGRDAIRLGGHVLPYRARVGGVLERAGYTEAAVDLARLAGVVPAGVLAEVIGDDGAVLQGSDLFAFAAREDVPVLTIGDLIEERRRSRPLVERMVQTAITTRSGPYVAVGYQALGDATEHMALVRGEVAGQDDVLVYIHLACWEGDVFRASTCDCRVRLDAALDAIADEGRGVVVHLANPGYLHHHRRANDQQVRDHGIGAHILADLGLTTIQVLSGRDRPLPGLEGYGLRVTGHRPLRGTGAAG